MEALKIYTASSWRNIHYGGIVRLLLKEGYEVYDFRNPPTDSTFNWEQIDPNWEKWSVDKFVYGIHHPAAEKGWRSDLTGMQWADVGILIMPCGRSAHMEAGYFFGAGKPLLIYMPETDRPELSYRMADGIYTDFIPMIERLEFLQNKLFEVQSPEATET